MLGIWQQVAGEELQPPRPLPWYPRKLAWQMDASRAQLRKLDALAAVCARASATRYAAYSQLSVATLSSS